MATVREVLARQPVDVIREILAASPRRFREELFRRIGVKARRGSGGGFKLASKGDARTKQFLELLGGSREVPEEALAEVVRNYLYNRRELLGHALDFLEVEHDGGLTDQDLDFLQELSAERRGALQADLIEKGHGEGDVALYMAFMGIGV